MSETEDIRSLGASWDNVAAPEASPPRSQPQPNHEDGVDLYVAAAAESMEGSWQSTGSVPATAAAAPRTPEPKPRQLQPKDHSSPAFHEVSLKASRDAEPGSDALLKVPAPVTPPISKGVNIRPGSTASLKEEEFREVPSMVIKLYSADVPEAKFESVFELYDDDSVFEDPLIKVKGVASIRQQFWALRNFLIAELLEERVFEQSYRRDTHSIEEAASHTAPSTRRFAIEALIRYRFLSFQPRSSGFPIKQTTVLEVVEAEDGSVRIRSHRDYWSVFDSLTTIPVLGWMYSTGKSVFGTLTTYALKHTFNFCKRRSD
mmetsp:Transcript_6205/g.11475  ORF Transcript_6205/g.11475 Transcript_6205/m.11475 type:complete len:317 (+) Transcript_6205:142-1092(+)|eukprot:CAMPEP_0197515198 /NCGR_PEP_ID=MMETSP1318-20131121/400_1 /TAXON_ID=552666 /ORGANISM="Partenskyella glossopodia, Strain RCC365" /LENGTH=316 /DNA_ID=CAMNT_0043063505 /DNA_START=196 /DNA_END=1146 /DNA_ORIENTATION=-